MALNRIRRIGIGLFFLCALPVLAPLPWGAMTGLVLDMVTFIMALIVLRSLVELIGTSWRGTWHT